MKLIKIIVTLSCLLGVATGLQAAATCNANIAASTPSAEFTDHNNGTVTHSRTGLMWKHCAEGQSWSAGTCSGSASDLAWSGALQAAVSSTTGGYSDWRLPNIKELQSLVEERCYNPSINESIFPNTPASLFWSASANAGNSGNAWLVDFVSGYADSGGKDYYFQVRLVRAGQSFGAFDALNPGASGSTPTTPLPQMPATPPLDAPTARNLVIVTHGWNSDTTAWPNALVDAICGKLGASVNQTGSAVAGLVGVDHSCKSQGTPDWVVYSMPIRLVANQAFG